MSEYRTVIIWHNVQQDGSGYHAGFFGYQPEHAMTPVFTYVTAETDNAGVINVAFEMFNAPEEFLSDDKLRLARRYRAGRVRSLSTGDVVQVGNLYYAVASFGWDDLGADAKLNIQPDPYGDVWDQP